MKLSITTQGDFANSLNWLNKVQNLFPASALDSIGRDGVSSLRANTPYDTGRTASGWAYKVTRKARGAEVIFTNSNVNRGAPVALLIQHGHGTGTGGYVPGQDYINPALSSVFASAGDRIAKEMLL